MNKSLFRLCAAIYTLLIFYISSLSHPVNLPSIPFIDKVIHFIEFGLLGYLVFNSFPDFNIKKREFQSIIISIFYAGSDEIHQFFVPGRNCDWADFLVDSMAIIIVILILTERRKINE